MKKGISLVALLITIIVMVILITTVTINSRDIMNNSTKIQFASELTYIQEMVYDYKVKNNNVYPTLEEYKFDVSGLTKDELDQFANEPIITNNITLYKIDSKIFGLSDLKYGNGTDEKDYYLLSKNTGKVYYAYGIKFKGMIYYTLTEDLKKLANYTSSDNIISSTDSIEFNPTTTKWTNTAIVTEIKVPKSYLNVNVTIEQSGINNYDLTILSTDDLYNIYRAEGINNNYTISVKYEKNGSDTLVKEQNYSVTNYDNTNPVITVSQVKSIVDNSNNSTYKYIDIVNKSDDLSGIKSVKYENSLIEVSNINTYFSTKGITVEDSIPIKEDTSYITVYIEDYAGNYSYIQIKV
jgi:type II secretory pathway pseudopilin PulG